MAPLMMSPSDIASSCYWIISAVLGLASILVLLLCMKKKKQNPINLVRYVQNDEMDPEAQERLRTPSNDVTAGDEGQTDKRASQHSMPNDRMLPGIPKNGGNGVAHDTPPTPDQAATPGAVSLDGTQRNSASSPKKSRRLPALPPPGQQPVDLAQAVSIAQNEKDIDATYEDLRDDNVASPAPEGEVVGSGDSALYAKVPEELKKQEDEDSDLYAQVGAVGGSDEQPSTSGTQKVGSRRTKSSSSEEDKTMDSPTAVTYASVDKMKKTMSIKRHNSSSSASYAPPVPDRNFEEEEEAESENPTTPTARPLSAVVQETPSTSAPEDNATGQARAAVENDEAGPAYDTVSVRESFAHQRLRQMVEDEQRNRYVNTSTVSASNPPDVYSQIDEENSEAVYESVSAPGSADGTVGVTARNLQANNEGQSAREDGYSTIGATRRAESNPPPTAPPNGEIETSDYDYAS